MKNLLKSVRQSLADREKKAAAPVTQPRSFAFDLTVAPTVNRTARRAAARAAAEKARKAAEKAARAAALAALPPPPPTPVREWLKSQPGSTRRGYYRGRFTLPSYVKA